MKSIRNPVLDSCLLRERLSYCPSTGIFRWTERAARHVPGSQAGHLHKMGYRWINIFGKKIAAHRLAWLYVHGKWTEHQIDHINGDKDDNRLENLRDVTASANALNIHKAKVNSKTGFRGISISRGKYRADICTRPKRHFLGRFDTLEEARAAYDACKRKLMGTENG